MWSLQRGQNENNPKAACEGFFIDGSIGSRVQLVQGPLRRVTETTRNQTTGQAEMPQMLSHLK